MNLGEDGGMYTVHRTFFVYYSKKMKKIQEHDLYLNQILHHFDLNFFPRMNNKRFRKRGTHWAPLLFLYDVSLVVLIDLIAILLTSGR